MKGIPPFNSSRVSFLTYSSSPLPHRPPYRFTGEIDRFGFESYLDRPEDRPEGMRADLHSAMEARLGLTKLPGYGHANK